MTALILVPTADTITGWLVLACVVLGLIAVVSACLAAVDEFRHHLAAQRAFDAELAAVAASSPGHELTVIDGHPVSVRTDRPLTSEDLRALTLLVRAAIKREQAEDHRRADEMHS